VADSFVELDPRVKLPLYARAGIFEVWLINLPKDRIEAHSEPIQGIYQKVHVAKRGESISSEILSDLLLNTDEILG
jgi:Uma2 family endonuclease